MKLRRHCYDKPRRCPGWAGGGWKFPKSKNNICGGETLSFSYDDKWWQWKSYHCECCGIRTIPFITRFLDPTFVWFELRWSINEFTYRWQPHPGWRPVCWVTSHVRKFGTYPRWACIRCGDKL